MDFLDEAVLNLEKAIQELEASLTEPAKDKTGLADAIAQAEAVDKTAWSKSSLAKLAEQLEFAKEIPSISLLISSYFRVGGHIRRELWYIKDSGKLMENVMANTKVVILLKRPAATVIS